MSQAQQPTVKVSRAQRTATLRRRATGVSVGVMLGAFVLVGVTAPLPTEGTEPQAATHGAPTVGAPTQSRSTPVTAARRVRTRQS